MTYSSEETIPDYPVSAADSPDMQALKKEMARTPTGRALLDFAEKKKIKLVEDDTIEDYGVYNAETNTFKVRKTLAVEDKINVIGHELRHAWQDVTLDYSKMGDRFLDPRSRWAMLRFIEADAFAFSMKLTAERMTMLRPHPMTFTAMAEVADKSKELARHARSWHGLSDQDYYQYAVRPSFAYIGHYVSRHLDEATKVAQAHYSAFTSWNAKVDEELQAGGIVAAEVNLNAMQSIFVTAPKNEEFIAWLRRFGGQSLDPVQKTTLADKPENVLLRDLPDLAVPAVLKPTVEKTLEACNALQTEVVRAHQRKTEKVSAALKPQ